MNVLRNNIKFEYLYRDAGNYKQYGQVTLKNITNLNVTAATAIIRSKLIDSEFFYPEKVGVPKIEVYDFNDEIDHEWYEFIKFSSTNEDSTEDIDITNFLERFG